MTTTTTALMQVNQMMLWIILFIGVNIFTFILWLCLLLLAQIKRTNIEQPVLIVTAHPDDEYSGYDVDLLCFTTGNYGGLGHERKRELDVAMKKLGIRRSTIIDSDKFEDGPNSFWPTEELIDVVCQTCHKFRSRSVVSFDEFGVSGHRNHCVLAKVLKKACRDQLIPQLFVLQSVSILRKYCFLIDLLISILLKENFICSPFRLLYVPYFSMISHKSQLVWFRWLYMYFSVYMYKNCIIRYERYS
ncbi:unnamed protein product [Schistosoma spindalis]|nr:unnamed protein product [Schistosoma spindale]